MVRVMAVRGLVVAIGKTVVVIIVSSAKWAVALLSMLLLVLVSAEQVCSDCTTCSSDKTMAKLVA